MQQILHHLPRLEAAGKKVVPAKEENQPGQVEEKLPPQELAATGRKKGHQWKSFGEPQSH
eukprot:13957238-Heterocapsa_arctica.AAC.1